MAQPFKHPTTGVYYLRRKVPPELRAALGREFKRSLKTRDPAEAKARFAQVWSEAEQVFALARAQASGVEVLGASASQQLAARWFRTEQQRLERSGAFTDMLAEEATWTIERGEQQHEHTSFTTLREAAQQDPEISWSGVVHAHIERTLRLNSLPVPPKDSLSYSRLYSAFDEHIEMLSRWALKRHEGHLAAHGMDVAQFQPIGVEQPAPGARHEYQTLRALFDAYAQEKTLNDGDTRATRRTLTAYRAVVEGFIELHGDLRLNEIGRSTIAQYRTFLARMPSKGAGIRGLNASQLIARADRDGLPRLSEPTIRNRLRAISAVLSCGVRLGWLHENPVIAGGAGRAAAKAATRRQASTGRRKHYTREELAAIFSSSIFCDAGWSPPRVDFGEAWYWLPLLLYFTGARREELAQLTVGDVKFDAHAGWYLDILATADDDGQRGVKTRGSRRLIPLHPDLIERGLIEYAQRQPPDGQLFPKLQPDPKGYFGSNFGKRWAVYLRKTVGLVSTASPAHGFRHTFKTLCREFGIPEEVHDAMTGHMASRTVSREYGRMPLIRMATELRKLPKPPVVGQAGVRAARVNSDRAETDLIVQAREL